MTGAVSASLRAAGARRRVRSSPFTLPLAFAPAALKRHIPNALTVARIVATPIGLWLLVQGTFWPLFWGTTIFIIAAITDYWDGRLARELDVRSRLGQFLDPLADKILVLGGFFVVPFIEPVTTGLSWPVGIWLAWAAIGAVALRDVAVTLLRSYEEARGRTLKTSGSAKAKTAWQLTFLISVQVFLTATRADTFGGFGAPLAAGATWLLASPFTMLFLLVTAGVTVYTGAQYFLHREHETV